jgi:hypothetical protein
MREVLFELRDGWKARSLIRDTDPDTAAPRGIIRKPPDVRRMDWEGVMRDLNNGLVEAGAFDWLSFQRANVRLVILHAVQRRLQDLYREVQEDG